MSYYPQEQQPQYYQPTEQPQAYTPVYEQQVVQTPQVQYQQQMQPVMQAPPRYASPTRQVPVQIPVQHQLQPAVQRMSSPVHVVKSRPPQQVLVQPMSQMQVQPQVVQYVQPVEQYQPVYYEEQQTQLVEHVPVQYVEQQQPQPVQYYQEPQQYEPEPPRQPQVVKSRPPPIQHEAEPFPPRHVKSKPEQNMTPTDPIQENQQYYYEDIEPTETDIGDGADMDEGTVNARENYREPAPVITDDKIAEKQVEPQPNKGVKNAYKQRQTLKNQQISPRITAMPTTTKTVDQQRANTMYNKAKQQLADPMANLEVAEDQEFSHDDWRNIQKKIDKQYERKLKEVGDDALKKLKMFQAEHKALLEKTQYLIEHSRIEDEENADELKAEQKPIAQTDRKVAPADKNKFFTTEVREHIVQDDFEYKAPQQLKNSAKGPQVMRKSTTQKEPIQQQPPRERQTRERQYQEPPREQQRFSEPRYQEQPREQRYQKEHPPVQQTRYQPEQQPRYSEPVQRYEQPQYEPVTQSAPQKRYMEPPQQFVQQPYQQMVQQPQTQQQQYAPTQPQQQPVRYMVPQQQEQQYYQPQQQQQPSPQYTPQGPPQQQQNRRPTNKSPMRQEPQPQYADQRPVVRKSMPQNQYPETFSEQPPRRPVNQEQYIPETFSEQLPRRGDGHQYSFGQSRQNQEQLAREPQGYKKVNQRNKSVPRDGRAPEQQQYQQPKVRNNRERSGTYKEPQFINEQKPQYNPQGAAQPYAVKNKKPQGQTPQANQIQQEEEPICVLKVELDGGQNVQLLRVFDGQIPEEIVDDFGARFNVSENAKQKLLNRIYEQLQQ